MATSSLTSALISSSILPQVPNCPKKNLSSPCLSFSHSVIPFCTKLRSIFYQKRIYPVFSIQAQTLESSGSFVENEDEDEDEYEDGDEDEDGDEYDEDEDEDLASLGTGFFDAGFTNLEEEEDVPPCPPGLRRYRTMLIARPDMSEDERLALTQKYEEVSINALNHVF